MPESMKKILKIVAAAVIAVAFLSVVNGVASLATTVDRFVPGSWMPVFLGVSAAIGWLIAYPVWKLWRLPRAPLPPVETSGDTCGAYQAWLLKHLQNHSDPEVAVLAFREGSELALQKLNSKADRVVYAAASQIFIETALSQNGRLDGLLMLARQVMLVWNIAKLYGLRPTPDRLWYLYSNVAMASVLSRSIEDMDLDEMVKPLVASVLPAAASAIPGMQAIVSMAVASLMDGAANALLTLRLGALAKQYALPLHRPTASNARLQASAQAYSMLSTLTKDNVGRVMRVLGDVGKAAFQASAGKVISGVSKGASAAAEGIGSAAKVASEKLSVAAEVTADAAATTTRAVADAGRRAAEQTAKASGYVGDKVSDAASATGQVLGSAGSAVKSAVVSGAEVVNQKARVTVSVVMDASSDAGQRVSSTTKAVASDAAALGGKAMDKLGSGLGSLKTAVGKPFVGGGPTQKPVSDSDG